MPLLLHRRPELQQLLRHRLPRGFENVDQSARLRFVVFREEGDGEALGAGAAGAVGDLLVCVLQHDAIWERESLGGEGGGLYRPIRWT